jgi:hypothetical protein
MRAAGEGCRRLDWETALEGEKRHFPFMTSAGGQINAKSAEMWPSISRPVQHADHTRLTAVHV